MPPRKKYQTMYTPTAAERRSAEAWPLLLPAATAEGDDGAHDAEDRRDQGAHVAADVVASRQHSVLGVGQSVSLGLVHEEEESVQAAVLLVAVEPGLRHPLSLELGHPGAGHLPH